MVFIPYGANKFALDLVNWYQETTHISLEVKLIIIGSIALGALEWGTLSLYDKYRGRTNQQK